MREGDQLVKLAWIKPRRQTCGYLNEKGCSVHEEKPWACSDFSCEWLSGFGDETMRPDQSGVILWREFIPEVGTEVLAAEEAYPGASKEDRFWDFVKVMARHEIVMVYGKGAKRTMLYQNETKVFLDMAKPEGLTGARSVPFERILEEEKDAGLR
jgi:hypothetical protein